MDQSYLTEAFKALDVLNEEDFNLSAKKDIDKLSSFLDDDEKSEMTLDIIDPDAETEEDLQDNYVGKVILDCCTCHSLIYKDSEDVKVDEESQLVNIDEECPYCYSVDGYKIVGEVAPYEKEEIKVEVEKKDDEDDQEVEEKEKFEESFKSKKLKEDKSTGEDLSQYQKWVDYDMKKYGKISGLTMKKIKSSGLSVVKDQYGDYEVIADRPVDEGCHKKEESLASGALGAAVGSLFGHPIAGAVIGAAAPSAISDVKHALTDDLEEDTEDSYTENDINVIFDRVSSVYCNPNGDVTEENYQKVQKYLNDYYPEIQAEIMDELISEYGKPNVSLNEKINDDLEEEEYEIFHNDNGTEYKIIERSKTGKNALLTDGKKWIVAWNCPRNNKGSWGQGHYFFDEEKARKVWEEDYLNESINKRIRRRKPVEESFEKLDIETENEKIRVTSEKKLNEKEEETIVPLDLEKEEEIELNSKEEKTGEDREEVEKDFDEFDEETFDQLGESYLKNNYSNIKSFKTNKVKMNPEQLVVEGVIQFKSGKSKKTSFIFEGKDITRRGKMRLIGENAQITRGRKAFTLTGRVKNNKFITESLNYNYSTKDSNGKTVKLYGTEKI